MLHYTDTLPGVADNTLPQVRTMYWIASIEQAMKPWIFSAYWVTYKIVPETFLADMLDD